MDVSALGGRALWGRCFHHHCVGASGPAGWRAVCAPPGSAQGSKLDARRDYLLHMVEATTNITLKEMQVRLREEKGVAAGIRMLCRFFRGHDYTKKMAHAAEQDAEQDRADVRARRESWFEGQLDLDPAKLVFVDETDASTKMARLCGRAPKGERLRAGVPHDYWATTTFGALRLEAMTAPMALDGPMTAAWFLAYAE